MTEHYHKETFIISFSNILKMEKQKHERMMPLEEGREW